MAMSPVSNGHSNGKANGAGSAAARVKSYARIAEVLQMVASTHEFQRA